MAFNFDFFLRPSRTKIDRANLEFYLHCSQRNLDRAISELDEACNAASMFEEKSRIAAWMDKNLEAQALILAYYQERGDKVLGEIETITMKLKQEHYPLVRQLFTSRKQCDELKAFLQEVHAESVSMATKYLSHR